jgi:DNA mismatch repair ATPase MutS
VALQRELQSTSRPASVEVGRLARLGALLASRDNVMFALIAALLMWATHCALAIEAWRARVGSHVPAWLDAVGELEALVAFGTFAAEHPDYVFPTLTEPPAQLHGESIAHPLLGDEAIANDAALGAAAPALLVVSGSNMSGKSTFLRALGVNVVLASAGGPVRAKAFRISPLAIGASIRIQDSLQDGRSRFFAEIKRLKQAVDLATASQGQTLFLLDENLAGTNSHDRRHGAEALMRGLIGLGAIGLVTTHDLALGDIAANLAPRAANVHFQDHFADGHLHFDYRLRPGIVQTSNAIPLMRSIGLDV